MIMQFRNTYHFFPLSIYLQKNLDRLTTKTNNPDCSKETAPVSG